MSCNHECRQGRDCPMARAPDADLDAACTAVAWGMTAIAVVAGLVHLAARMGWMQP